MAEPNQAIIKRLCAHGPSSSADITRMMRGQPKRLSHNYLRRNGKKRGEKLFYMFWFSKDASSYTDVPCTPSCTFLRLHFRLHFLLVWLFILLSFIRSLKISKPQRQWQRDSMLPCVCSVIDHRWRQNVFKCQNVKCMFIVVMHLATKLVHRHATPTEGNKYFKWT